MTLEIPQNYQHVLNEAVASGAFVSHEDALKHALELLAVESSSVGSAKIQENADQWAQRFKTWADGHPVSKQFVDFSRDSVYEGRGL